MELFYTDLIFNEDQGFSLNGNTFVLLRIEDEKTILARGKYKKGRDKKLRNFQGKRPTHVLSRFKRPIRPL